MSAQRAFVVQFAADADPAQGRFEGRVEHVSSGHATHFHSEAELVAFFVRILPQGQPPRPDDP